MPGKTKCNRAAHTAVHNDGKHSCPLRAGARVLRQDPVECLFEFICSSNNHISRIKGMVERLCQDYGTPLTQLSGQQTWFVCPDEILLWPSPGQTPRIKRGVTCDYGCHCADAAPAWSDNAMDPAWLSSDQTPGITHETTCACDCNCADAVQACSATAIGPVGLLPGQTASLQVMAATVQMPVWLWAWEQSSPSTLLSLLQVRQRPPAAWPSTPFLPSSSCQRPLRTLSGPRGLATGRIGRLRHYEGLCAFSISLQSNPSCRSSGALCSTCLPCWATRGCVCKH